MGKILQIKATLKDSKPPIWRRLLLPGNMNFHQLHFILQLSFNWTNSHLHEFDLGDYQISANHFDDDMEEESIDSREVTLGVSLQEGQKISYLYDFGDSWEHQIVVEKTLDRDEKIKYPCCIAGKRNGPIEDSGGIHGYENILHILTNKNHEDYEEIMEWVGGSHDGEAFNIEELNEMLTDLDNQIESLEDMMF